MKRIILFLFGALAFLSALNFQLCTAFAQGTTFTYQGRLSDGAYALNGTYDLRFALYDAASGGAQQGNSLTNTAIAVTNGLFMAILDFGNQFVGGARWLGIGVRTNGVGDFITLTPRQVLTPAPYAIYASGAGVAANISGTISASQISGAISSNNIAAGTITSLMLADGAVTAGALADNAVTADKLLTLANYKVVAVITNPVPLAFDYFGQGVAACGSDKVIVGAYALGTNDSGAVYLLSTNGLVLATCANPNPLGTNRYGSPDLDMFGFSVSGFGTDKIIVGAYREDTGIADSGAAYLFNRFGALITTFTNPTPAVEDFFGYSVAAVGVDKVVIGAWRDDTAGTDEGAAYVFNTNGQLLVTIANPAPSVGDAFGYAVAACGIDRMVINAFGAAYLYNTNGTLLATLENPSLEPNTFGASVAVVGSECVLIGAIGDSSSGPTSAGAAYLFDTNGVLLTTFKNPVPSAYAWFGATATAVGSDKILIGSNTRSTYLFDKKGFLLATITNSFPASDDFGLSLAALGPDRVIIGAGRSDIGATDAGAAYLVSVATFVPGVISQGASWGSIDTDSLADRSVTSSKIANAAITFQKLDSSLATNIAFLNANQTFTGTSSFAGISSPKWKAATVINTNLSLPLTGNFTSGGGTLVISASGSGYTSTAGLIGMDILLDGNAIDSCQINANLTLSHMSFVPKTIVRTGVAAGNHTITLNARGTTLTTSSNDFFCVTVLELPF